MFTWQIRQGLAFIFRDSAEILIELLIAYMLQFYNIYLQFFNSYESDYKGLAFELYRRTFHIAPLHVRQC